MASTRGAGCGDIHFPPNAMADYDYGNTRTAASNCASYGGGQFAPENVSGDTWHLQGDFQRGYLRRWYAHIPRADGNTGGIERNWWKYLADFNAYNAPR